MSVIDAQAYLHTYELLKNAIDGLSEEQRRLRKRQVNGALRRY